MSLLPDTRLAHYQIRAKLGAGGMGEVYLADDTRLNRKVAIKFLPAASTSDERARKRLVREAQAAAALDHPNICAIHEVGEADGQTFIVMQYVEGETLAARIQRKPLDSKEALDIAVTLADALAEAHALGIIHRDIKPQNIMITARGQIKILDFGLAKMVTAGVIDSEAETQSFLTQAGMIVGTVPYMSPEQVKGEALDARSDIFSFGAVLYELISGHCPFAARTTAEIISAILTTEPQPLASHPIAVPPTLDQVVRKCLHKDLERRYQSMREVAADLENVRRDLHSGVIRSTADQNAATIRMASTVSEPKAVTFFSSRRRILFTILVSLIAAATVYLLFFRVPQTAPPTSTRSVDSPAYDYYLRGKVIAGSENRESNINAIKLLEQAIAIDPNFAPAYAELARAYNIKAFYFGNEAEKKKLNEDAKVAVEKALGLNPDLAEGHSVRGFLLWTHDNRFPHERAIQAFKRALELNPNLDETHHRLAVVYFHIGLLDKAWDETEKALSINPANTLARFRLGIIQMYRARYDDALAVFKTIPREVNPVLVDRGLATALFQLGRTEEAGEVVEEYLRTNSTDEGGTVTSVKAMLFAKAGKEREAEETIQRAIEIGKGFGHFHHTTYNIASAYALLNKPEPAMKWLQVTADDGFPCYPLFENDANLNSLRKDPRFIEFMTKMKQQWERYNATL